MAEFEEALDRVAGDMENAAAGFEDPDPNADPALSQNAVNARIGQEGVVEFKDGEISVNGEKVSDREALKNALKGLTGKQKSDLLAALQDADKGNPSTEVVDEATAQGKANGQKGLLQNAFEKTKATDDEGRFKGFKNMLAQTSGDLFKRLITYTSIAGASYGVLNAMAAAKTGCYVQYGQQKTLISKDTAANCVSFTGTAAPYSLTPNATGGCATEGCPLITNTATQPASADQLAAIKNPVPTSCNCVDPNNNNTLVNPNVALSYQPYDAWDIFGDILNGIGCFIQDLGNDFVKIVSAAADVVADLPKILMWTGIAAAIVGVIVGIIFLAKKLHEKKKARAGVQGGKWSQKRGFKHWKKSMKQLQRSTPYSHLTMSQAMFH